MRERMKLSSARPRTIPPISIRMSRSFPSGSSQSTSAPTASPVHAHGSSRQMIFQSAFLRYQATAMRSAMTSMISCSPVESLPSNAIVSMMTGSTPIPGIAVLLMPIRIALTISTASCVTSMPAKISANIVPSPVNEKRRHRAAPFLRSGTLVTGICRSASDKLRDTSRRSSSPRRPGVPGRARSCSSRASRGNRAHTACRD